MKKCLSLSLMALLCLAFKLKAQTSTSGANYISTGVSFLTITPDSRGGAMGETGVSTSPDINSLYWNPSKFAAIEGKNGIAISYSPWMKKLVDDMSFANIAGYHRIDKRQVIGASMRYFNMGEVNILANKEDVPYSLKPYELALDFSYSRRLTNSLYGGVALRYIYSNLTSSISNGADLSPGNSIAADISFYWYKRLNRNLSYSWGVNISNIGSKISYSENKSDFLPTNLRLGNTLEVEINKYNKLGFTVEINKLMVPTPDNGNLNESENTIVVGSGSEESFLPGMMKSFTDAPGGFSEELKEVALSVGVEYSYMNQFQFRAGTFLESKEKGNRRYGTFGMGVNFQMAHLDFSYLIPFESNHPLGNTLRFSLALDLSKGFKKL